MPTIDHLSAHSLDICHFTRTSKDTLVGDLSVAERYFYEITDHPEFGVTIAGKRLLVTFVPDYEVRREGELTELHMKVLSNYTVPRGGWPTRGRADYYNATQPITKLILFND